LKALGDARRQARKESDAEMSRRQAFRELVQATERLYDHIERMVGAKARREFIADGLAKTKAWLAEHDDRDGRITAQMQRLLDARRRLTRESDYGTRDSAD
jgi:hypothetical protein